MSHSAAHVHKHSLIEGLNLKHPQFSGYMFKQSHLHRAFNKRYFVLFPKLLIYYTSEHEYTKDVQRKTLEHRHRAIRLEGLFLTKPDKKPPGAKFCFILHCPNKLNERHEYLLVAENREDRRKWMDKLQEQNPHLLEHAHHNTLEVPGAVGPDGRSRIRADSINPETMPELDDVHSEKEQDIEVVEGHSDHEDN